MTKPLDSVRRLRAYIYSGTKMIPEDANDYTAGQVHENKCLFCRNPASEHPVMSQGIDTWTQMCEFCYKEVNAELPKYLPDAKHQQKEKLLLNSLSRGYDFNIPEALHKYYTHLDGGRKDYFAGDKPERCFICDREQRITTEGYKGDDEFYGVEIPVRSSNSIVGGTIHICADSFCYDVYQSYTRLLSSLGFNQHAKAEDCTKAHCATCRKTYYVVGDDEIFYRMKNREEYEWQCPSCTYRMFNVWEKDKVLQKFYPGIPGEPREELLPRYSLHTCHKCSTKVNIDNFQTEFSFFLNNVYEERIICRPCSLLRTWFEQPTVLNILDSKIYAEIHPDYTFSVFRLTKGQLESLIINGNTSTDNIIDTLFVAYEETIKLLGPSIEEWK